MGLLDRLRRAASSVPRGVDAVAAPNRICSPASGRTAAMADVPDPVFARGLMGRGCAVWPEDDAVYAPTSGTVQTVMGHALGLCSDEGIEVLVHIGVDTVEMQGDGFEVFVKPGDRVSAGQALVRMSREKIRRAGHPDCVIVVVTNSDDFESVEIVAGDVVCAGAPLLEVAPAE